MVVLSVITRRSGAHRALVLCIALLAALAAATPAAALTQPELRRALAQQMRSSGASGALVVDVDTGERLYAKRPKRMRIPASVEKLYTTSAALLALGPDARLRTDALATQPIGLDGTLDGDVHLRGTGDPTLTTGALQEMARMLVAGTGLSRVTGIVIGDERAFDRLRGAPSEGYAISPWVAPLGALMVNRGRTGLADPYWQADPAAWAATKFAEALRAEGVRIRKAGDSGATPPGAMPIVTRQSPDLAELSRLSNVPSDNWVAEMLLKVVGATSGEVGTTARGAAVAERLLANELGIHPRLVDGSGLSRSDRTSPRQVVRLLTEMLGRPEGDALYRSLAVMGRTGTLSARLRRSYARSRCRGKTGTLRDVSNLAGYCRTRSGDTVAFAILMNRVWPSSARRLQDRMVHAIARYSGG